MTVARIAVRLFVLLAVCMSMGCASARFNPNPGAPSYPPYDGTVEVLAEYPSDNSYESLGVVIADGGAYTEEDKLLATLQETAAKHGANAVVLQSKTQTIWASGGTKTRLGAFAIRK